MILQALSGYYERIAATGDVAEVGYGPGKISYRIILARNGNIADVEPTLESAGKRVRPREMRVPAIKRTSGIQPSFLWDKTAYVFGVSSTSKRSADEHKAFRTYHEQLLAGTNDEGLLTFLVFLKRWDPAHYDDLPHAAEMRDTNVVFQLEGDFADLHQREEARAIWAGSQAQEEGKGERGFCLVTGMEAPIARLHASIKGVPGAQSSGAPLVSFNLDAFESYGKSQGANAPVSERAAHAYATALNHLLSASRGVNAKGRANYTNRVQIGDATTVFFAKARGGPEKLKQAVAEEEFVLSMMDPPPEPPSDEEEAKRLHEKFRSIEAGRPLKEIDSGLDPETRFFVIGISPNAARLSVRFFEDTSLGDLAHRMGRHWADLHIEPNDWRTPPAFWRLLRATAPLEDMDRVSPALAGELARAAFAGTRYPQALLSLTLMRLRAGDEPDATRVAIIKACIARNHRLGFEEEDVPVSLDLNETNAGYRLGRLFAVLENAQYAALGKINAGIRDKFYSSASATPARIFPLLVRGAQDHIAKIRKMPSRSGLSIWFDRRIAEIVDGLPASGPFPAILRLEDQGRFAVGYYHERNRAKSEGKSAEALEETTSDEE